MRAEAKHHTDIEWTPAFVERFWRYVRKGEDCWEWTAGRFSASLRYGQFRAGRRKVKAHRFAWTITKGPIPDGLKVLHRCDNPICVRPDHLFLGTDGDNIADRDRKGRTRNGSRGHGHLWAGERNPAAKISAPVAAEIRQSYQPGRVSLRAIAAKYGLSQSQVSNIVRGTSWA